MFTLHLICSLFLCWIHSEDVLAFSVNRHFCCFKQDVRGTTLNKCNVTYNLVLFCCTMEQSMFLFFLLDVKSLKREGMPKYFSTNGTISWKCFSSSESLCLSNCTGIQPSECRVLNLPLWNQTYLYLRHKSFEFLEMLGFLISLPGFCGQGCTASSGYPHHMEAAVGFPSQPSL